MFVGFDTSNYTTSAAVYDRTIIQAKQVLTVKPGERGLRQSDAVFQHTVNLPKLLGQLDYRDIEAVGVSTRPRSIDGSYMPCFLVGEAVAAAVAETNNVPLYKTSHQIGHILAALYSAGRLDLIYDRFIAFHLSGGTTEALLVTPDKGDIIKAEIISESTDLKAGQAIDRTGVMLNIPFPCGKELDRLSALSGKTYKIKPSMQGLNCSLSGVENKAKAMLEKGACAEDISKFVLTYITKTVCAMLDGIINEFGRMPILFSGGVSSNSMLRNTVENKYGAYFAKPEFSLDNAAGVAVYAKLKQNLRL